MLRLCLLLLLGAVHCVHAVEEDTDIHKQVASFDEEETAYMNTMKDLPMERSIVPYLDNFLSIKNIALVNLKRQSEDVKDSSAEPSGKSKKNKTDDVFGDDGPEPMNELFEHIMQDWQDLIKRRDIDAIVNKYTEDAIHIYHMNGETRILTGRESFKNSYEEWFNQDGLYSVVSEPKAEGRLGTEFLYLVNHIKLFDKKEIQIAGITGLLIFKHIMHDNGQGGYAVRMVSEIHD